MIDASTLNPVCDLVVVRRDEAVRKSRGGIELPEGSHEHPLYGTVVATGPGAFRAFPVADGQGTSNDRLPMHCKVGDRVIIPPQAMGLRLDPDDKDDELIFMSDSRILAVVSQAIEATSQEA